MQFQKIHNLVLGISWFGFVLFITACTSMAPNDSIPEVTSTLTPTVQVIESLITSPDKVLRLRLDSWSPDSQWIAYWYGENREDIPANLAFVNVPSKKNCLHAALVAANLWDGQVIWQADGNVIAIVKPDGLAFYGAPCELFKPVVYEPSQESTIQISPDGRFRAETEILEWEGESIHSRTNIIEISTDRNIVTTTYSRSPHFSDAWPKWLGNDLYIIRTVEEGWQYFSIPEGSSGNLLTELLGLNKEEAESV